MNRYDVCYYGDRIDLEFHFCREWGCYGTNPLHGFTFEEAKKYIISELENEKQIEYWKNITEDQWLREAGVM